MSCFFWQWVLQAEYVTPQKMDNASLSALDDLGPRFLQKSISSNATQAQHTFCLHNQTILCPITMSAQCKGWYWKFQPTFFVIFRALAGPDRILRSRNILSLPPIMTSPILYRPWQHHSRTSPAELGCNLVFLWSLVSIRRGRYLKSWPTFLSTIGQQTSPGFVWARTSRLSLSFSQMRHALVWDNRIY